MKFEFGHLFFNCENERIKLSLDGRVYFSFSEVQVAGENKDSHFGAKLICSSEGIKLRYVSKEINDNILVITQKSDKIIVKTVFEKFEDTSAIRIFSEITNTSNEEIVLEEAPIIVVGGIASLEKLDDIYFTRFIQGHHIECQPRRQSLFDLGITRPTSGGQFRVARANIGSWSTKEELPQGILEYDGNVVMFQIESNSSWYYEISDYCDNIYLCLSGASYPFGGWCKKLACAEKYTTPTACLCFANSVDDVIGEMTKYRRKISGKCTADENLPVIFNEYMHLSWDSPNEERTKIVASSVAKTGTEYYVIDCGWSNEEDGSIIYPYLGQWRESKARFPSGLKKTTDYIRSLGMKPGLWIEPEIVGYKCEEMLAYYDDDCFIKRHGKKVCVMGRYFLDFRNSKVRDYLTSSIRRMVIDYGAEYVKFDYNQDMGVGTETDAYSAGEGLEKCAKAYIAWVDTVRAMFPNVVFETCSSGGMRMDYETMRHFSIVSTSDQIDYKKYPYIAANIASGVLPEQAAVWSYPVGSELTPGGYFNPSKEWVEENITEERVVFNFVNAMLGRIHLASHIELLSPQKYALAVEGIECYKSLTDIKKKAFPVFPCGFADFTKKYACSGLKFDGKLFLAVWSVGGGDEFDISLNGYKSATCLYPKNNTLKYSLGNGHFKVCFTEKYQARFFELSV